MEKDTIKWRYILGAILASMIATNTDAQKTGVEGRHTLIASAGVKLLHDNLLLLSSERLTTTGIEYSFVSSDTRRQKSIELGFDKSTSSNSKRSLSANNFYLQYSNAFSVLRNNRRRWNNYTGYGINLNPQYVKLGDQYSWMNTGSLTLYNSLTYSWKKSSASLDISLPLVGFSSRPKEGKEYNNSAEGMLYNSFSHLDLTSVHNLQAMMVNLRYQHVITQGLYFAAGGTYSYKEISTGNDFLEQSYRVHAGLSWYLK